jgi:hypothetical protein
VGLTVDLMALVEIYVSKYAPLMTDSPSSDLP